MDKKAQKKNKKSNKPNKKKLILSAALQIIETEGLRGLTYRSIAKKANVPLGLTTYYFDSIEDIYTSAYLLFVEISGVHVDYINNLAINSLKVYKSSEVDSEVHIEELIESLSRELATYVRKLVTVEHKYRLVEAAFIYSSFVNNDINYQVANRQSQLIDMACQWFEMFGTENPNQNAHMFVGLLNHLERWCMLNKCSTQDSQFLEDNFRHFFNLLLKNN